MDTIAFCMIVKNEESILRKCLESIKGIPNELIIVDTGSTDNTVNIAKEYTDKVYYFEWIKDFSAAYNYSHNLSTSTYNCRWDADFVLQENSYNDLLLLKQRSFDNIDIAFFTWNIEFGIEHQPIKSRPNWFIFKKDKYHFESPIHAGIVINNDLDVKDTHTRFYPYIQVDHYKDPIEKKHRYAQTSSILKTVLESDPNNTVFLFHYAEGLIFEKKYFQAINILKKYLKLNQISDETKILTLETLIFTMLNVGEYKGIKELMNKYYSNYHNHSRFILAYADATAAVDINGSIEYYEKYIANPVTNLSSKHVYDYERHYIHPYLILAQIYLHNKDNEKAKNFLEIVFNNTRAEETKLKAETLLNSILK